MVEEEVHIKLPECKVEARFVFKNDGPATTITIGFPEQGKDTTPRRPSHLVGFKSWVDGKLVSTQQVFAEKPDEGANDYYYKAWWIKKVPFAKGQTRTIVNKYSGGWYDTTYGVFGFNYILKTGATWRGTIGRAQIICDISSIKDCTPIRFSPAGSVRDGNIVRWDLHNLKPKEDVWVKWFYGYYKVRVNGKHVMPLTKDEHLPTWVMDEMMMPQRRGRDVWIGAGAATEWLSAASRPTAKHTGVRLSLSNRWIEFTKGSKSANTSSGTVELSGAVYVDRDHLVFPLSVIAKALGGFSKWDDAGWLNVTFPKPPKGKSAAKPL